MKWKIFCAGTPLGAKSPEEGLNLLSEKELGDELAFTRSIYMNQERAKVFGKIASDLNVPLSIHAPYFLNLANPEKQKQSERIILTVCQRGEAMKAECVVIHAGYYMENEKKAYDLIERSLKDLVKKTSCPIGVEVMGKVKSFGTIDEAIALSEINGIIPVMDFAHWYARNRGKINYEDVLEKFKKFKHLHTHFSGIEYGPSGEKKHLPLSHKHPDFEPLAKLLVKKKLDINLVCECPDPFSDALKMKNILEKSY